MAVEFRCPCGELLRVDDQMRGRAAFCTACRRTLTVPAESAGAIPPETSAKDHAEESAAKEDVLPLDPPNVEKSADSAGSKLLADAPIKQPEQTDNAERSDKKSEERTALSAAPIPTPETDSGRRRVLPDESVVEPKHVTQVKDKKGQPLWKLTCHCGKRILSPFHSPSSAGRCPKCARSLRLPGHKPRSGKQAAASGRSAQPDAGRISGRASEPLKVQSGRNPNAPKLESGRVPKSVTPREVEPLTLSDEDTEEDVGTIILDSPEDEARFNRDAALRAADRLRQHKIEERSGESAGRISAWPLAGRGPRFLAGFIDLTFVLFLLGLMVGLASYGVVSSETASLRLLPIFLFVFGVLYEFFFQLAGGTIGKRVVVVVMRRRDGCRLNPGGVLLRAISKWLLIPGWLLIIADPAERALHDLICRTLVLKGRIRK
jgi:uncharacterized RDD family membrane protein YckC